MNEELEKIIKRINKGSNLPGNCFRRNSVHYNLVTYTNHIIALFFSESLNEMVLFINRANKEIDYLDNKDSYHEYFIDCIALINEISDWIIRNDENLENDLPLKFQRKSRRTLHCPGYYCFHWNEEGTKVLPKLYTNIDEAIYSIDHAELKLESNCGCLLGTCTRIDSKEGNKDWYEPNEPKLNRHGLPEEHFKGL